MPFVTRLGDQTSCSGVAVTASPNVYADKINLHRLTDLNTCANCAPPGKAPITAASPTTYANDLKWARLGDPDACVGDMVTASPTTAADSL